MSATSALRAAGVSIWLDDLSRERIRSGGLGRLISERDVVGITTNPTIFANAISAEAAYREQLDEIRRSDASPTDTVFSLITADVRAACDILSPVFDETGGVDGRVSVEVSPAVAHDSAATLAEVHQLTDAVDRPNLFVKIPATPAGLTAIADATAAGISINVTLIFGLDRYRQVVDAYLTGLERARDAGRSLDGIQSVASFFVSRVDVEVDRRLEAAGTAGSKLSGQAAIANAHLAYEIFEATVDSERWRALERAGANPQRPLWASTGVKSTSMRDTIYVEELVAPRTVNTMPQKTLEAVWDHGTIRSNTIEATYDESRRIVDALDAMGISLEDVSATLEAEGIATFSASWERLIAAVADGAGSR